MACKHIDTVYPRAIPMDPPSPPQVPQGPMTRARARAFETEVTSLLALLPYESCETWLLPQASVLCVLRCDGDHFGEELEDGQVPKVVDEPMHREGQKRAPGPGHPAPWPGHPAPGHSPTEGQQQLRLQGPDIRPGTARTSGPAPGNPAPLSREHPRPGHSSPDIRPMAPDVRRPSKPRTSGPPPGHPAPDLPACSPLGRGPCTRSPRRLYILLSSFRLGLAVVLAHLTLVWISPTRPVRLYGEDPPLDSRPLTGRSHGIPRPPPGEDYLYHRC